MTAHAGIVLALMTAMLVAAAALLTAAAILPHHAFWRLRERLGCFLHHPRLARLWRERPELMRFLAHHFHGASRSWLRLAIGCTIAAAGAVWFVNVLHRLLDDPTLVVADQCLHNTLLRFNSPVLLQIYSAASDLASAEYVFPLVIVGCALFWLAGRRRAALGLVGALVGSQVLSLIFKHLVARPRPPEAAAILHDSSFPSGHTLTATAVYGFLVYLILRDEPRRARRWLLAAPLLFLIGAVPLSRIYLGFHWPYDTVGSLALGGAWLAILITLFKLPVFARLSTPAPPREALRTATIVVIGLFLIYGAMLAAISPQRKVAIGKRAIASVPLDAVLHSWPADLPRTSEDAVGGPMEPVSIVLVGSRVEIEEAFRRAGWQEAETPSVHGLLHELWGVAANRPDPRGPATPAYYAQQPQDMTFEKPGAGSATIRRRHHTRFWETPLCAVPDCRPIFVATASYDAGVKLVREPYLLTHRIDLHVDVERDLIVGDLLRQGLRRVATLDVTGPLRGNNAAGDHFVTDGRAVVLLGAPLERSSTEPFH
jgi:membrane-associated phospholipid phosphatase